MGRAISVSESDLNNFMFQKTSHAKEMRKLLVIKG